MNKKNLREQKELMKKFNDLFPYPGSEVYVRGESKLGVPFEKTRTLGRAFLFNGRASVYVRAFDQAVPLDSGRVRISKVAVLTKFNCDECQAECQEIDGLLTLGCACGRFELPEGSTPYLEQKSEAKTTKIGNIRI